MQYWQINLPITFRFSTLKEIIEKELGVRDALILDERGIDISTLHTDDLVQPAIQASNSQL